MGVCNRSKLLRQNTVHRKIERRRLDIQLELDRVSLVPVVGEAMRVPILAELFVRPAAW
jgi:hypothetical protein